MSDARAIRDRQKHRTPECLRQRFPALPVLESATPVARVFFAYFGRNGYSCATKDSGGLRPDHISAGHVSAVMAESRRCTPAFHAGVPEDETPHDGSGAGPGMATGLQAAPTFADVRNGGANGSGGALSADAPHRAALSAPGAAGRAPGVEEVGEHARRRRPQEDASDLPQGRPATRANPEKFEFLSVVLPLTMLRAVPQHNFSPNVQEDALQRQVAEILQLERTTVTARISNFAAPYNWQAVRELSSEIPGDASLCAGGASSTLPGEAVGANLTPKEHRTDNARVAGTESRQQFAENLQQPWLPNDSATTPGRRLKRLRGPGIFRRRRRCFRSLEYKLLIPSLSPTQWIPRALPALCKDPSTGHLWDRGKIGVAGFRGYKDVPTYFWRPELEISEVARVLLTAYWLMGLGDYGVVEKYQDYVADYIGVSKPTVREANAQLQAIGLIRVAHQTRQGPGGRWLPEGPVKILWVPGLILSADEAILETERMLATRARLLSDVGRAAWDRAFALHQELLRSYQGHERKIAAFRRDFRAKLAFQQFPRSIIEIVLPPDSG